MRAARMFVLDTTVVSQLTSPFPDPAVVAWIERAPHGTLMVPSGAVFEIQVGVELAKRRGNRRADDHERRLDRVLSDRRFRILSSTPEAARIRAAMAADPELRNLALPDPRSKRPSVGETLAIAASAVAEGAAIATLNRRDFAAIGRRFALPAVFDPGVGAWVGVVGLVDAPECGGPSDVGVSSCARRKLPDGRDPACGRASTGPFRPRPALGRDGSHRPHPTRSVDDAVGQRPLDVPGGATSP